MRRRPQASEGITMSAGCQGRDARRTHMMSLASPKVAAVTARAGRINSATSSCSSVGTRAATIRLMLACSFLCSGERFDEAEMSVAPKACSEPLSLISATRGARPWRESFSMAPVVSTCTRMSSVCRNCEGTKRVCARVCEKQHAEASLRWYIIVAKLRIVRTRACCEECGSLWPPGLTCASMSL